MTLRVSSDFMSLDSSPLRVELSLNPNGTDEQPSVNLVLKRMVTSDALSDKIETVAFCRVPLVNLIRFCQSAAPAVEGDG